MKKRLFEVPAVAAPVATLGLAVVLQGRWRIRRRHRDPRVRVFDVEPH